PGGPEPAPDHHPRQCPGCHTRFLPPLSRRALSQRIQARRHAFAHRVQVFAQSLSTGGAVSRFWSDHLADLSPYVAGEQPKHVTDLLKLNTNEHPYGPSPKVLEAIRLA